MTTMYPKTTPNWAWLRSRDPISKFLEPLITLERIELSISNFSCAIFMCIVVLARRCKLLNFLSSYTPAEQVKCFQVEFFTQWQFGGECTTLLHCIFIAFVAEEVYKKTNNMYVICCACSASSKVNSSPVSITAHAVLRHVEVGLCFVSSP